MIFNLFNGLISPFLSILFIACFAHIRFRRLKWKGSPLVGIVVCAVAALAVIGQLLVIAMYVTTIAGT